MTPFSWKNPYAWPRKPLLAQNVVATSQPLAAQAGLQMLRRRQRGGCDPRDRHHADAGRAGVERHRLGCLRHRLGRQETARPERLGALAGGVDARLLRRQQGHARARLGRGHRAGLRLGLGRAARQVRQAAVQKLFEPAIRYGREGFLVSPTIAGQWAGAGRRAEEPAGIRSAFLPGGRPPRPGEIFTFQAHAKALEEIAATKGKAFYGRAGGKARSARQRSRAARCAPPTWRRTSPTG